MFILTILKWILIVLLIVLLVVVLIGAYLLVLPVFYDIEINFDEKSFEIHSKDLLRLYNIGVFRENKKIKISLKALFGLLDLSPKESGSDTKKKESKNDSIDENNDAKNSDVVNNKETKEKVSDSEKDEKQKEKQAKRKEKLKQLLKEKETYEAVKYVIYETFKTLQKLLPKYFYAKMDFSLGKPDLTGLFTGGLSLLPFIYQNSSKVIPDFVSEKAYVNGYLKIKGNFALINFVILFTKLIINKQIRRILQTLL